MITMSGHGLVRSTQRAISQRQISIVIENGFQRWHKGQKVYFMRNKDIEFCLKKGVISVQEADKLHNLIVVASSDSSMIITAYRARDKKQKQVLRCG